MSIDHLQMEVVKPPKNQNESFGHGMVLKITCDSGYNSNIQTANSTVRCNKGVWKPVKPVCSLSKFVGNSKGMESHFDLLSEPCFVPSIEHGKYYEMPSTDPIIEQIKPTTSPLTPMDKINNGLSIAFQCDTGYNIQGSSSLKCIDGNWSSTVLPECLPSPCVLPEVMHAVYQGGYRAGLSVAHSSHVMVQCDNGLGNPIPPVQIDCALGALTPQSISCSFSTSRKSRDDDERTNFILDEQNATSSSEEDDCGPPSRELAMLIYKNEEIPAEVEETYPAGTEISFNCMTSVTGERTTWKILCEEGSWIGRAHDCGEHKDVITRITKA